VRVRYGSTAITTDQPVRDQTVPERADQFAFELSELGRRYSVGLGGNPLLFLLEPDDYWFDYSVDVHSRLRLGNSERDSASGSRGDS
jgi:hypothetical protein